MNGRAKKVRKITVLDIVAVLTAVFALVMLLVNPIG